MTGVGSHRCATTSGIPAGPPRPSHNLVELLTAYSHSTQAADLWLCRTEALISFTTTPGPTATRPWSLRDRLTEHEIAELIIAYRDGATSPPSPPATP